MAIINGGKFLQKIYSIARRGSVATPGGTTPSVLEVNTFSHNIARVDNLIQAKALKPSCSCFTETLFGSTLQKISKTWTALAMVAKLAPLAELDFPYILLDSE